MSTITLLSPMDPRGELDDPNWLSYVVVRVDCNGLSPTKVRNRLTQTLNKLPYVYAAVGDLDSPNDFIEDFSETATAHLIETKLKEAEFNVLSVDIAEGLTWLNG